MPDRRTLVPALLTAAITALLAVAAFASAGSRPWGGEENRPRDVPSWLVDAGYTLAILLGIAGGAVMLWLAGYVRAERRAVRGSWFWRALAVVTFFAFALSAAYALRHALPRRPQPEEDADVFGPGSRQRPTAETALDQQSPEFQWWLAIAVILVVGAVVAYLMRSRWLKATEEEPATVEADLSQVLDETLDDLRRERDPRRAVIAAYARMEQTLGAHGLPRKVFEAPLEYLARVLRELRVGAGAIFALTELFERAKFSPHEIDVSMKDEAIAALVSVRDDLRAAA
jgi:membrane protein implicated in regulation of membrane protease activity